ncbi:diguanylate cyclase [Bdellovibrio sp. HCB2-146]|uniref:tetratricopeptide repeat-containing diguanylate cyclase n=1 Tax=Bdellovibrio sp. HCB2-146 TaxID=3394362 RepID=UPI0039BD7A5C
MRVSALFCLILACASADVVAASTTSDLLAQARELLGESPHDALKIIKDLETQKSLDSAAQLEADLIRCGYYVDNDDSKEALQIVAKWTPHKLQSLGKAEALELQLCQASAEEKLGKANIAEQSYLDVLSMARSSKLKAVEAEALLNLGQLRGFQGDYSEALVFLENAQTLFYEVEMPHKIRITLNSIAILYGRMGEDKKAIEYFTEVLEKNRAAGKKRNVAVVLYNLGRRYESLKDFTKAESSYEESLKIHTELGNEASIALVHRALGSVYNETKRPKVALASLDKALKILEAKNRLKSQAGVHLEKAISYRLLGMNDQALEELDHAELLSEKSSSPTNERDILEQRSLVYAQMREWQKAYTQSQKFKSVSDQILNNQKDNQLARVQLRFETSKKEQANQLLRKELETASRIQVLQMAVISLLALLFSVGGFFAIRQVRLARQMKSLALTDELTQIPNRRHILAYGEEALRTCKEQDKPFSVLIFDIDHFKRVNDSFGHAVGDQVIQRIAAVSKSFLRQADRVGRIGGEEFLVILPFTPPEAAKEVAERIRDRVARTDMTDLELSLNVTVSVGVCGCTNQKPPLDHMMNLADEALYQVKQNGRNGVRLRDSA